MRFEESVEITRPVDQVFDYLMTIENLPTWETAILELEQTSPGQIGVGSTFRGTNKVIGRRMDWTSTATEYELNKRYCETITSGSTTINLQWILDPVAEGTKFTVVYDVKMGGILGLLLPLMKGSMRKQFKENLSKLKSILEAQP